MELFALYESTKASFAEYQTQGKKYGYPAELKEAALELLTHFPEQRLARALGITSVTLRNWLKAKHAKESAACAEFVSLPLKDGQPPSTVSSPLLTLTLPHGLSLTLPEQPVHLTAQLISALVRELSSCSI